MVQVNHQFRNIFYKIEYWDDKWALIRALHPGFSIPDVLCQIITYNHVSRSSDYEKASELERAYNDILKAAKVDQSDATYNPGTDPVLKKANKLSEVIKYIKTIKGRIAQWKDRSFEKPPHASNRFFFEQISRRYLYAGGHLDEALNLEPDLENQIDSVDPLSHVLSLSVAGFAADLIPLYATRLNGRFRNGEFQKLRKELESLEQQFDNPVWKELNEPFPETQTSTPEIKKPKPIVSVDKKSIRTMINAPINEAEGFWVFHQSGDVGNYSEESRNMLSSNIVVNKRVDQHHLWTNAECASAWFKLIGHNMYKKYGHCLDSLETLVSKTEFKNIFVGNNIKNAIMLGGGGGFGKDRIMMSNLPSIIGATTANPLIYKIVDISPWMLEASHDNIARIRRDFPELNNTNDVYIKGDFFKLKTISSVLNGSGENSLWTITGGTLGNIDEAKFIDSLNDVAMKNDLLIISASTYQQGEVVESGDYNNTYIRNIIYPILSQMLVHHPNFEEDEKTNPLDRIWATHRSRVSYGRGDGFSKIEKTQTEVLNVMFDTEEITILNHTHYLEDKLRQFFEHKGWKFECSTVCKVKPASFDQFLFSKK